MSEQTSCPMISILTPCYNTASFLPRLMDSILSQNYPPSSYHGEPRVEHILINDGSTDNTEEVILSYQSKYEEKGYRFIYRQQENQGLGGTINNAMKLFHGDFFTCPDPDDFYYPGAFANIMQYFHENPSCGVLQINNDMVPEHNLNHKICTTFQRRNYDPKHLKDKIALITGYVTNKYMTLPSTGLMIRTSEFLKINPKRDIFPSRVGQNWQLILPMLYYSELGLLEECQGALVVRMDSHSHALPNAKARLDRINEHEKILQATFDSMLLPRDMDKYFRNVIGVTYARIRAKLSAKIGNWADMRKNLKILSELNARKFGDLADYFYYLRSFVYRHFEHE